MLKVVTAHIVKLEKAELWSAASYSVLSTDFRCTLFIYQMYLFQLNALNMNI